MSKVERFGFKKITNVVLLLILICALVLTFNVQLTKAEPGTIYIRADGSVEPSGVPISNVNNTTYTFTSDVGASIVVQRSNITINGNGNTLQGPGKGAGFNLTRVSNVTVRNTNIKNFSFGIYLNLSSFNIITENKITNNGNGVWLIQKSKNNTISQNIIANQSTDGIWIYGSTNYNNISRNNITNNVKGIYVSYCDYNIISRNNIANNNKGVSLEMRANDNIVSENNITNNFHGINVDWSERNAAFGNNIIDNEHGYTTWRSAWDRIFHNNFINNTEQDNVGYSNFDTWDDGYPSGGNYWSHYNSADAKSGQYQNISGSDGIVDTAYTMDAQNQDNYPLTKPYGGPHDIGIVTPILSKTVIGEGYPLTINIRIINYGIIMETFNLTVSANSTDISVLEDIVLASRNSTTISLTWNTSGFSKGSYNLTAVISTVPDETNLNDNIHTYIVKVTIPGDVSGDFYVDISDATLIGLYWMQLVPPAPANVDINGDGIIDIADNTQVGLNWLKYA